MYFNIVLLSLSMSVLIYFLFYLIAYKKLMDMESSSAYECGFDINSDTRLMFSYRFFLISILFLIFDVEIVLMIVLPYISHKFVSMNVFVGFILILILGLLYEYWYGSLNWLMI